MLSERMLSFAVQAMNGHYLKMKPWEEDRLPRPRPGKTYMLYAHVPFCISLCPYCSFNRFPFEEGKARKYFLELRDEIRMLSDEGYDFESMYIGGGTPTILADELAETITLAKSLFSIRDVSAETNPNHLNPAVLDPLRGLVDRMSVGVQSFDDGLLRRMCRYEKYGSGAEILEWL
ncbi:MAG: radical SAM protein, partial [Oscillospiraceae bacterium]|nr:radical SAM protein [Oscillospiraceae bacterium]